MLLVKMKMFKYFLLTLFVVGLIDPVKTACYTPWGSQGYCVNIRTCDPLLTLLRQRPLANTALNVLRRAQCGFEGIEPKVCCEFRNEPLEDPAISSKPLLVDPVTIKNILDTTTTTSFSQSLPPPVIPIDDHPHIRLLENDRCGPIPETRIYGGAVTAINEFPWMALLGYDVGTKKPEFRCGASLINKRYVLTAAHCVTGLPDELKLVTVRLGDYDLSKEEDCDEYNDGIGFNCAPPYQELGIDRVDVHPDFTKIKLQNDIALVRLEREADLTPPNVCPICLPLGTAAFMKTSKVIVTGWGSTEFGHRSEKLMKVTLPIVNLEKCSSAYKRQIIKIWYKQICAGGENKMDSCSGDSGGPLQAAAMFEKKPRIVQYGIVSFGPHSCGMEGFPGVYTRVAYYVRWILDSITD